jgi:DHA1 family multidrug resistance protein-like MFS transporter
MNKDLVLLFCINALSAIGYSLIAPLYPSLAKDRNMGEGLCGTVIAIFAVSNFIITPFCPVLIQKYGRKNIMVYALVLEVNI